MQRRNRPVISPFKQSRVNSILPSRIPYKKKRQVRFSSPVPLIFGSIISLIFFVLLADRLKIHNLDAEHSQDAKGEDNDVIWVIDNNEKEGGSHRIANTEIYDSEKMRQMKTSSMNSSNDKRNDNMVQGKFFKIYKQQRTREDATAEMMSIKSSNVDGEKRLKNALKKVVEDQSNGKNLNIGVLSRWMGEDIPVTISANVGEQGKNVEDMKENETKQSSLSFPSPLDAFKRDDVKIVLKPEFGHHREDQNAVFAFAEGYPLNIYAGFVDSLLDTGFDGDIVLSVSSLSKLQPEVLQYLKSKANLVVYTVDWECFSKDGKAIDNANGGMSDCRMKGMFSSEDGKPLDDPREPRPVATARYELYWAWAQHYEAHSQILLIDSRDTIFQKNPFEGMTASEAGAGILRFYGENAEVTSLSISTFNKNWLIAAYGDEVFEKIKDRPVICSGSTIGEQIAIETYLQAMIQQFDETKCKKKGCDQGFHNYLYYYDKLVGTSGVEKIIVYEQGKGAVNNLGAMKTKPLKEWGILETDTKMILNWDNSVSPVVHQVDRDDDLKQITNEKRKSYVRQWKKLSK